MREALPEPRWQRWVIPAFALLFCLVTARGYGIFRDELYYLANADHLGWGYVDHPPLIGWVTAAWRALFGDSLVALRALPALAFAATIALAGGLARQLGGSGTAARLAELATLTTPFLLALTSYLSMNCLDVLVWVGLASITARLAKGDDPRLWLAFGAVAGLGLLNKLSVLFLGFGLVLGWLLARRFEVLRTPWFWFGGALAGLLFAPFVGWQVRHGAPTLEFMENARRYKNAALSLPDFFASFALGAGPLTFLIAVFGLGYLLFATAARPFRMLGWAPVVVTAVMLAAGGAKDYYLAPVLPLLYAAGAVAFATWVEGRGGLTERLVPGVAASALLTVGALIAPLAKPILPVETYVRYAERLGQKPGTSENKRLGRLPQFFADMQEWEGLAAATAKVYQALPAEDRAKVCVFGQNYGEAGAIDHFRGRFDLPPAISGHNSYYLWGPGRCTGEVLIVLGDNQERLAELFEQVELGGRWDCRDCMPYEDNLGIWVVRGLRGNVGELWPRIKHYD